MHLTLPLLFSLLCVGPAPYPSGTPGTFISSVLCVPLTESLDPAGRVRRLVTGDFDADQRRDLAAIVDGRVVVQWGPSVFQATQVLEPQQFVADIVVIPGPHGTSGIAVAHASGVDFWTFDRAAGRLTSKPLLGQIQSTRAVAMIDLGSGGDQRAVAALDAEGGFVYLLAAWPGDMVPGAGFPLDVAGREILGVRWNGGVGDEVAVLTDVGVDVYSVPLGERLASVTNEIGGSVVMQVLRGGAGVLDSLAWIQVDATGDQWLEIASRTGQAPSPRPLGPLGAEAIAQADVRGNGLAELVLGGSALCVVDGPPTPGEDPQQLPILAPSPPGVVSRNVAVTDLDNDGRPDLLSWWLTDQFCWFENQEVASLSPLRPNACNQPLGGSDCPIIALSFDAVETTSIELLVFKTLAGAPAAGGHVVDPMPLYHLRRGEWIEAAGWHSITEGKWGEVTVSFDLDAGACDPGADYYFVCRRIDTESDTAGPDLVLFFRDGCLDQDLLGDQNGTNPRVRVPFGAGGIPNGN